MVELNDNLKARYADYINGKKVNLSDEELNMLAQDDALAAECMQIAEISSEYDSQEIKKGVKNFKLNVLLVSVAACLMVALMITVFYENQTDNSQTKVSALSANQEPEKGWGELSEGASGSVKTASTSTSGDFYTAAPDTPFELEPAQQGKIFENDPVDIFVSGNPVPVMKANVKSVKSKDQKEKKVKKVKFKDGLAEGLYEYRIYHEGRQVDQGGFVIGQD